MQESEEKQEQEMIISSAHKNWTEHPMTKAVVKKIQDHRMKFIEAISNDSFNVDKVPAEKMRLRAAALNTCDAILALIEQPTNLTFTLIQQEKL